MRWIFDSPRIISGILWKSYSMKLEDWSLVKQKSLVWPWLISKNLHGARQVYVQQSLLDHTCENLHLLRLGGLCGKMGDDPIAAWKNKIKWYSENNHNHFNELNRIDGHADGVRVVTTLVLLESIKDLMKDLQCELEQFNDRIIFMSMHSDIVWGERRNTERCEYNSQTVANYARRFPRGRWSFLGLGSEKKWYGTHSDKPDGAWDKTAEQMMLNFAATKHPSFELPHSPGHVVPGNAWSRKETWLVRVLSASCVTERERSEWHVLPSWVGWSVSFKILIPFENGVPLERGCPVPSSVPPCVNSSEGWEEDVYPFSKGVMATVGRLVSWLSSCASGKRELSFAWLLFFGSFPVTDVPALVRCHFVDTEPRRLRLTSKKNKSNNSQDSPHWAFSKRFKKWWLIFFVNLSSSKEGSSSCQCTTTFYGENEETQQNVRRILLKLRVILADSRSNVGHFGGLDQRRNVRDLFWPTRWKMGQDCWTNDAQFCRKPSSDISWLQRLWGRWTEKQRKGK